jgi:membrane protease YdiL (CAAX protease family)
MTQSNPTPNSNGTPEPSIPAWPMAILVATIAACSIASYFQHGLPNLHLPGLNVRLSGYVTVIAQEWLMFLVIWLAFNRRNLPLSSLVGTRWRSPKTFFQDLGFAIALTVITIPIVNVIIYFLNTHTNATVLALTPKSIPELIVWFVLAWSAAYAEELVFRGYLQRQFSTWTHSAIAGILLQGICFGLAHGFYGKAMLAIMVHGSLLGFLAQWRKSLLPGMLAHGIQDTLGGVLAYVTKA